ncbi:hypothetical protein ABID22_002379 [Pontibacter aydingkolensis]|uniref:Uncharacterized protein n=1 Tax=Pontibacter aydingkolensis TaxID=1911536 RepID=A0ABS7CVW9_9BACT|nr:hypothetical protein [Pontibacter aydingkolensis]MBW7467980.1 hypothetical protein [Pontibacter aydingkolensis]
MLSTIIAIVIAIVTGTTPGQPTTQDPAKPTTETKGKDKTTSDPAAGTFGGSVVWIEG